MALPFTISRRSSQMPAEQSTGFGAIAERFRRAGELERAVALCQEGLQKFPEHLSARVTLGWAFLDLGKHDEARSELERVIRRAPDNLAAIRGLAALHDRMESAVEHMEASVSWPPPSLAVPAVAPPVAIASEVTPEVHAEVHTELHTEVHAEAPVEQARLEDLPLFQAAAQQEQEEAFHQRHAYQAPVEDDAPAPGPFLPFETAAAEPMPAAPVASIDDFDPVFPAAALDEPMPTAVAFDEPVAPVAFELPAERITSALESELAYSMAPDPVADSVPESLRVAEPVHVEEPMSVAPAASAPAADVVHIPEPVQITEQAHVDEPFHVAASVQIAEPVHIAEPVQIAEPVHVAEAVYVAEPVHVEELGQAVAPVQAAEPVQVFEAVQPAVAVTAEPARVAEPAHVIADVPELLDLEPLLLTIDDEPRPAGAVTVEPIIDEPLSLDDAMPLTLDVEAIAVEDASVTPAPGQPAAHVVFPVRMQPAKPALVALEKLLRRVEDRKLAALAGSLAS